LQRSAEFHPEGVPRRRGSTATPKARPRRSEKTAKVAVYCGSSKSLCRKTLRRLRFSLEFHAEGVPGDEEILQLQRTVLDDQRKQRMLESLGEARNLLAAKRFAEGISRLTSLQKEFPDEDDISRLLETAQADKAEQQRQQGVAKARKLLASRRHEECGVLLLELQKQFPVDDEIPKLLDVVRKEQAEQQKLEGPTQKPESFGLAEIRGMLALLARLQSEHANDNDITRLLETAREDQAEQRKLKSLAEARSMLTSRNYEECISLLVSLEGQHPKIVISQNSSR